MAEQDASYDDSTLDQSMDLFDSLENEPAPPPPPPTVQVHGQSENIAGFEDRSSSVDTAQFQCPFCNAFKKDEYSMQQHIFSDHGEDDHDVIVTGESHRNGVGFGLSMDDSATFVCPYCSAAHHEKYQLAEHLTRYHKDIDRKDLEEMLASLDLLLCPICLFFSITSSAIEHHIATKHSDDEEDTTKHKSLSRNPESLCGGASVDAGFAASCPFCGMAETDPEILQSHIELHFESSTDLNYGSDQHSRRPSSSKPATSTTSVASASVSSSSNSSHSVSSTASSSKERGGKGKQRGGGGSRYKTQYKHNLEKAVMRGTVSPADYHEQMSRVKENDLNGVDDGHSRVQGMIEKLQRFYESRSRKDQQAFLCHPTDYFCGSYGDKGWGCGYRNFQMLLSCLIQMPPYAQRLSSEGHLSIPSVPKVQEMIEGAWRKGFDREGSLQLEAKLVKTSKWIGATEIVATLSSLGIKCELVDFPRCSSPDGSHPRLLQWVQEYFVGDENLKPPLYLQHQGHSRTIVGVEIDKGVTRLLLFDPGSSLDQVASLKTGLQSWKQMSTFRRNVAAFKANQYQIVSVVGVLNPQEKERSKRLTSTRVL